MSMPRHLLLLAPGVIALAAAAGAGQTGTLVVSVSGFHSASGKLLVGVHDDPDAFPSKPGAAARSAVVSAREGRVEFRELPSGVYAVAVCHDENANEKCDTNFIGIPTEGTGASRGAVGRMGPPKFDDAKFSHEGGAPTLVEVTLSY